MTTLGTLTDVSRREGSAPALTANYESVRWGDCSRAQINHSLPPRMCHEQRCLLQVHSQ